uniref:Uncharacterized protein n=1 Tax=Salmo trutta TaxID=8032 RepID=A0A674AYC2_SALTR
MTMFSLIDLLNDPVQGGHLPLPHRPGPVHFHHLYAQCVPGGDHCPCRWTVCPCLRPVFPASLCPPSHGCGSSSWMHHSKNVLYCPAQWHHACLHSVFFRIDNVIWIYMLTVAKLSPMVADKRVFSSCYASLSPIFIISSNKKAKSKLVCAAADQEQPSADTQDFSDNISN